ncbi:MAG TPA: DUF3999 family protein, partial [Bacillota bacterium]|nr:DUF3999 family protein [Bacillota bacterium]
MMKKSLLIVVNIIATLIVPMLFPAPVQAAYTNQDWAYRRLIEPPASQQPSSQTSAAAEAGAEQYARVMLDGQTFDHAVPGLADLRIVQGAAEIPYYVSTHTTSPEVKTFSAAMLNNSLVVAAYSSFVLDLSEIKQPHNKLSIQTTSTNFLRRVEIEGTDKLSNPWNKLTTTDHIFDFRDGHSTEVNYSLNNFRYLRVKIWNKSEPPLAITGAQVFYQSPVKVEEIKLTPDFSVSANPNNKTSLVTFDLGSRNFPTDGIELKCSDENFSRRVSIEGSNDGKYWQSAGEEGTIYSYSVDNQVGKNLTLKYTELAFRFVRVVIYNQDNAPLHIYGGILSSPARIVIFPYDQGKEYFL